MALNCCTVFHAFTKMAIFVLLLVAQPMVMHLACVNMRLTMPEALVAATLNAAASVGKSHEVGSLEKGKMATMLIIAAPR